MSSLSGESTLQHARRRVRDATRQLHTAAAAARACGLFNTEEEYSLRRTLREGRRFRGATPEYFEQVADRFEEQATEIRARLGSRPEAVTAPAALQPSDHAPQVLAPVEHPLVSGGEATVAVGVEDEPDVRGLEGSSTVANSRTAIRAPTSRGERRRKGASEIALAEMTQEELERVSALRAAISALDRGVAAEQALSENGLSGTRRWLLALRRRFQTHGYAALVDRRRANRRPPKYDGVRTLAIAFLFKFPRSPLKAVWAEFIEACKERGLPTPGYDWFLNTWEDQPAAIRLVRTEGMQAWQRIAAPVGSYPLTRYANEIWVADNKELKFDIKEQLPDGRWVRRRLHVTGVLDIHSRACPAAYLQTRKPTSWTFALALRKAILPKKDFRYTPRGVPDIMLMDNGSDFQAKAIWTTLKAIGSHPEYCPEYYPNAKPEMERFLRTAEQGFFSVRPGYRPNDARNGLLDRVDHLFTLRQAREELDAWLIDEYHERPHAGISTELERSPRSHWEATVHLAEADPRDLDPLILQRDQERVVGNRGIRLKFKQTGPMVFWHPTLANHWHERVKIAYNPDDLASVLVYYADTGEFVCEAYRMGVPDARYTSGDVVAARNRAKKGLVERLDAYAELVQDIGRPIPPPPPDPISTDEPKQEPEDAEVLALIQRMEARDREIL